MLFFIFCSVSSDHASGTVDRGDDAGGLDLLLEAFTEVLAPARHGDHRASVPPDLVGDLLPPFPAGFVFPWAPARSPSSSPA